MSAEVVAEVRAAFAGYEKALVAGDVATMTEYFWSDPEVVRFGVDDEQWGPEELLAFRRAHPSVPAGRTLTRTRIVAFGTDTAVVSTLFGYPGKAVLGRQSQMWRRLDGGWRIVHAHVSEISSAS